MAEAHGRMIHRLDSEGLLKSRHRAKRRRAKGAYIGACPRNCQRLNHKNITSKLRKKSLARPSLRTLARAFSAPLRAAVADHTPYNGHIPPPCLP
jgi:hypothetical protein